MRGPVSWGRRPSAEFIRTHVECELSWIHSHPESPVLTLRSRGSSPVTGCSMEQREVMLGIDVLREALPRGHRARDRVVRVKEVVWVVAPLHFL
jgi:hypothetical protein